MMWESEERGQIAACKGGLKPSHLHYRPASSNVRNLQEGLASFPGRETSHRPRIGDPEEETGQKCEHCSPAAALPLGDPGDM